MKRCWSHWPGRLCAATQDIRLRVNYSSVQPETGRPEATAMGDAEDDLWEAVDVPSADASTSLPLGDVDVEASPLSASQSAQSSLVISFGLEYGKRHLGGCWQIAHLNSGHHVGDVRLAMAGMTRRPSNARTRHAAMPRHARRGCCACLSTASTLCAFSRPCVTAAA